MVWIQTGSEKSDQSGNSGYEDTNYLYLDLKINFSLEWPALFQYPSKSKKDKESIDINLDE